jgi:hypothetical protein
MKKETIIAITLGIGLGIIVAVFIVFKNRQSQIQKGTALTTSLSISPTAPAQNNNIIALDIVEPTNGTIVNKNSVTIKGTVAKDALVVIQSPIKNLTIKTTSETLDTAFPLALGENVIHIVVYPKDSHVSVKEKELQVYYLDEQ